jgi:hypothetical protein
MEIFFGIDELAFSASIRQCVDFLFFCKHSINKSLDLTLGKNNKMVVSLEQSMNIIPITVNCSLPLIKKSCDF